MKSAMASLAAVLAAVAVMASAQESATTPVGKVVSILQEIQKALEAEQDKAQAAYEAGKSWYEANIKKKEQAIEEGQSRLVSLDTQVQGATASAARLTEEISSQEGELAKSKASLDSATTLRENQATEFKAKESELLGVIKAIDAAIAVLSRSGAKGAAFLDASTPENLLREVNRQIEKHSDVLLGAITPSQKRLIAMLSQAPDFKQEYTPRSGEILQILRDMKATFEASLKQSQDDEAKHEADYLQLKSAKTTEIDATQTAIDEKKVQLAAAGETKARSLLDIQDTKKVLEQDTAYLADLGSRSNASDAEYGVLSKVRSDELAAVVEAISILSSDQATSAFSKTFKPASLLQVAQLHKQSGSARAAAVALLDSMAQKSSDSRITALAASARADALKEVKDAIQKLIEELLSEEVSETKQKDDCAARTSANVAEIQKYQQTTSELEVQGKTIKSSIDELAAVVKTLEEEIAYAQDQLKKRDADREVQHKVYQSTITDHQKTQELLQQAIAVLKKVYGTEAAAPVAAAPAAVLLQTSAAVHEEPEVTSGTTKAAGSRVVALLEQILLDAKALEAEALSADKAAEEAYAAQKEETEASVTAKQRSIVDKNEEKAKTEQQLLTNQGESDAAAKQLQILDSTAKALDLECLAVVKEFDARKEARSQEVEALRQALAVLAAVNAEDLA